MSAPVPAMIYTQSYGSRPQNVPIIANVSPSSTQTNYTIGQRWVNSVTNVEYVLTSFSSLGGSLSATWTPSGSAYFQVSSATAAGPLVAGTLVITDAACLTTSIILVTYRNPSNPAVLSAVPANGSFTVNSASNADTSTFYYAIINS